MNMLMGCFQPGLRGVPWSLVVGSWGASLWIENCTEVHSPVAIVDLGGATVQKLGDGLGRLEGRLRSIGHCIESYRSHVHTQEGHVGGTGPPRLLLFFSHSADPNIPEFQIIPVKESGS